REHRIEDSGLCRSFQRSAECAPPLGRQAPSSRAKRSHWPSNDSSPTTDGPRGRGAVCAASHAGLVICDSELSPTVRRAVVLAGGQGARLRPYTAVLPKPLLP